MIIPAQEQCPISGKPRTERHGDCEKCIAQEEAWSKVQCYIACHNYTWTIEGLRHDYQKYYTKGYHCSHTFLDVVRNNEAECKLLFGKEES